MSDSNKNKMELTQKEIEETFDKIEAAVTSVRESIKPEAYHQARMLLKDREPEIDIRALKKKMLDIHATLEQLSGKKDLRKETLDGVFSQIELLPGAIKRINDFWLTEFMDAAMADRMKVWRAAKVINDVDGGESIMADFEGVFEARTNMSEQVLELFKHAFLLDIKLALINDQQEPSNMVTKPGIWAQHRADQGKGDPPAKA